MTGHSPAYFAGDALGVPAETAGLGLATAEATPAWLDPLAAAAGVASIPTAMVASMAELAPTAASFLASPDFMRGCSVRWEAKSLRRRLPPRQQLCRAPRQSLTKASLPNHKQEAFLNTP
ncbi:hypothetical protein GCM10022252_59510 [Streptosporangium oxazolinicum]|uniref:Uncharacterized protein n=1 Tax=Streptosporangium oxazolinicum TaxID=909287 RepID=A0ABP8BBE2_9ACTN